MSNFCNIDFQYKNDRSKSVVSILKHLESGITEKPIELGLNSKLNVDPIFGLSWGLIGMATFALLLFIVFVLKQEPNHPLSERFINMGLLTTGIGVLVIGREVLI